jgi:hypothetical protein
MNLGRLPLLTGQNFHQVEFHLQVALGSVLMGSAGVMYFAAMIGHRSIGGCQVQPQGG